MYSDDDLLPLSGLQHLAYCERQWALIHVEQQWNDSADTIRGDQFHERVDMRGYVTLRGFRSERRVQLRCCRLGLFGIADVVEYGLGNKANVVRPVEYKVGKPKVEDWDRVQLAAQSLCLEEMTGEPVAGGALFYGETRRREEVLVDAPLRARVEQLARRMHELFGMGVTPPAFRSSKCRRCSLRELCLPVIFRGDVSLYWKSNGIEFSSGEGRVR